MVAPAHVPNRDHRSGPSVPNPPLPPPGSFSTAARGCPTHSHPHWASSTPVTAAPRPTGPFARPSPREDVSNPNEATFQRSAPSTHLEGRSLAPAPRPGRRSPNLIGRSARPSWIPGGAAGAVAGDWLAPAEMDSRGRPGACEPAGQRLRTPWGPVPSGRWGRCAAAGAPSCARTRLYRRRAAAAAHSGASPPPLPAAAGVSRSGTGCHRRVAGPPAQPAGAGPERGPEALRHPRSCGGRGPRLCGSPAVGEGAGLSAALPMRKGSAGAPGALPGRRADPVAVGGAPGADPPSSAAAVLVFARGGASLPRLLAALRFQNERRACLGEKIWGKDFVHFIHSFLLSFIRSSRGAPYVGGACEVLQSCRSPWGL